jgi:hypothetical protein
MLHWSQAVSGVPLAVEDGELLSPQLPRFLHKLRLVSIMW